jgi:hypothetical protein
VFQTDKSTSSPPYANASPFGDKRQSLRRVGREASWEGDGCELSLLPENIGVILNTPLEVQVNAVLKLKSVQIVSNKWVINELTSRKARDL